jgi:4-hydroxy-3-polyprenylbenzoate decarboxylase
MRLVVGITGATGSIYGIRLLEVARQLGLETHLVMSPYAVRNIAFETGRSESQVQGLAHQVYDFKDLGAPISSGSFITSGMVVVPCSIKTLSGIATSYNNTLVIRAADVCLKERRKLVLVVRETPLHLGHLRLMAGVTEMGGVIMPPVPAFYHSPKTIDDLIDQTVGKVLDQFGIDAGLFDRWSGGSAE